MVARSNIEMDPPIKTDQEWANALTHGAAAMLWVIGGGMLIASAAKSDPGLMLACAAYVASVVGTFLCSTLSHVFLKQPWLDRFRSWDQAMIYLMIVGTYTPITYAFAPPALRDGLLAAMWLAAGLGFASKVFRRHRINQISAMSYLMLGWLPAMPLIGNVPQSLAVAMLAGGIIYSLGVAVLMNDHRVRYSHALWHVLVFTASVTHGLGIAWYVV